MKKVLSKKWLLLLMAIGMVFVVSACSSEEPKEKPVETKKQEIKETKKEEAKEPETEESVEITDEIEVNTVYGNFDKKGFKKVNDMLYRDEERDVLYMVADGKVFQVEVNLDSSLGINLKMDNSFLIEHAFDYMAEDATLIQKKSNKEFVYESKKFDKKYDVIFSSDGEDNVITRVIVTQHLE